MRIFIAFVGIALACTSQAQLYRWTDSSGKVHYSDTQPPAEAKNVEKKSRVRAPEATTQQPYALQQALEKFPVTVYTSKNCGDPCKLGLEYLKKRGVPYTEKVVGKQSEIDQLAKLTGARQVPALLVGTDAQTGYTEQGWNDALDAAGYPKPGTP